MLTEDTTRFELLLEDLTDAIRTQRMEPPSPDLFLRALQELPAVPTADQIAQAVTARFTFPKPADLTPVLNRVAEVLDQQGSRVSEGPRMAFGNKIEIRNGLANPVPVDSRTLATESTLNAILDATANVEDAVHVEVENIAANVWTPVVSYTPTAATTVLGFNADVSALVDIIYRMRLTVGGVVKCSETIGASANSWIPLKTDVAAGTAITVDVFHGEVAAQTFRASLSYGS